MQIKDAVQQAKRYMRDVFEAAADKEVQLEGLEKSDDARFWKITFSYLSPETAYGPFAPREYKTVKLRDSDGAFIGIQNGMLVEL